MFLMYVDESGDPGLGRSPSPYYVLTGLILHELRWKQSLDKLLVFRRGIKAAHGLRVRIEIHASEFVSNPGPEIFGIPRHIRLLILRKLIDNVAGNPDLSIITIIVNKSTKSAGYDVFEHAWQALIQRFENTIRYKNFPGPNNPDDKGLIFPDNTSTRKLRRLLRKMRYHNYIPRGAVLGGGSRNLPIEIVIEDPNPRDSRDSYLIQVSDVAAYFAHQFVRPNRYVRQQGARNFYRRLAPVLCTRAAPGDPVGLGLVRL